MAHDAQDPYSRRLELRAAPFPKSLRFGLPSQLEFFGDEQSREQFEAAVDRMKSLGGEPVTFDYTPFAQAAALLYESALVAERYAAIRGFFDAHPEQVIEPVRSIIAQGKGYSAADVFDAQLKLKALAQRLEPVWQQFDCMVLPTAPRHYTIAQMQAVPVGTATAGPSLRATFIASEYLGSAVMNFFDAGDGHVIEMEHHLSLGAPQEFEPRQDYLLTWNPEQAIVFGREVR
jgi:Asp-tRNA(Asn)/Glu-tRNA(Gln) amidotransferase A subunit family amidase